MRGVKRVNRTVNDDQDDTSSQTFERHHHLCTSLSQRQTHNPRGREKICDMMDEGQARNASNEKKNSRIRAIYVRGGTIHHSRGLN
jgi:hypothetical protein